MIRKESDSRDYETLMELARTGVKGGFGVPSSHTYALMAIADRLDLLCKLMEEKQGKSE